MKNQIKILIAILIIYSCGDKCDEAGIQNNTKDVLNVKLYNNGSIKDDFDVNGYHTLYISCNEPLLDYNTYDSVQFTSGNKRITYYCSHIVGVPRASLLPCKNFCNEDCWESGSRKGARLRIFHVNEEDLIEQ